QDNDVVIVDAESHRERTRFLAGATDMWTLIRWNGFRPRARGLDVPVSFGSDPDAPAAARDHRRAAARHVHALVRRAALGRPGEDTGRIDHGGRPSGSRRAGRE